MRKVILLFILITSVLGAWADGNVTFTASAPDVVVSGDQFRLTYTVNTHKVRDFRAPNIKGFDVLMGPSRSQQSSTQIINGNVTSTSSITFTYILMADKEGTYTIPGATIVADGQNKTSNPVQIKVLPPDQTNGVGGGNNSGGRTSSRSQVAGSKITNQDLFITATASKTTVYEQEAILLTYKVYTLVNLRQLYGKMPDLKNFHTQEVELPQQKTFSLEHYNGRNYNTTVWSQYVLFPQQSGKMEIPSITFEGVIAQQVASDDPFDAFFNGGSNYVEVKKNIVTPKLTINVKALPLAYFLTVEIEVRVVILYFTSKLRLKLFSIEMSNRCGTADSLLQIRKILFNIITERVDRTDARNNYSSFCHKFKAIRGCENLW